MIKKIKIAIVNADEDSARAIRQAARIDTPGPEVQEVDEPAELADGLAAEHPAIVFFGIDREPAKSLQALKSFTDRATRVAVIGLAERTSPQLLLEAMRAGVDEFLTIPLSGQSIIEAVRNVSRKKGLIQAAGDDGRIFTVFSGKGGCGKTMLATNLAYQLSRIEGASVIILDLNLQFGNVAAFLDLQPRHTLVDCVQKDGVVEDEVLVRIPCKHASGLSVIAGPEDLADAEQLRPEQIEALLSALQSKYDFVIVDTACSFDELNLMAFDMSEKILLVCDTLVPSVKSAQRCMKVFDKLSYDPEKIVLVINRLDRNVGAGRKELQQAFGMPVAAFLPNEFTTVMGAVDAGMPIAEAGEKSGVAAAIAELAVSLTGEQQGGVRQGGWFRKLTGIMGK